MRKLKIEHTTTYRYSNPVRLQPHKLLIRPREGPDIRIASATISIEPEFTLKWHRDAYNNAVGMVEFQKETSFLNFYSEVVIRNFEDSPLDFIVLDYALNFPFHYPPGERTSLMPFLLPVYPDDGPTIRDWVYQFWQPGQVMETFVFLDTLNKTIPKNFDYTVREEMGVQSPVTTLNRGSGSCRDYATLFMEACRYVGLASRFVSGYLHCEPTERGHGATHAWSEVYLPGSGWKGFDSTSGEVVGNNHIPVAVERHPEAVPPISGSFVGMLDQAPTMEVKLKVTDIKEISPAGPSEASTSGQPAESKHG